MKKRCGLLSFKNKQYEWKEKYTHTQIHVHTEIMTDTWRCFNIKYHLFQLLKNRYRNSQLQRGRGEKLMEVALLKHLFF